MFTQEKRKLCDLGHHGTVRFVTSPGRWLLILGKYGASAALPLYSPSLNHRLFRFISPVVIAFSDSKIDYGFNVYLVAHVHQTQHLRQQLQIAPRFPDRSQGCAQVPSSFGLDEN